MISGQKSLKLGLFLPPRVVFRANVGFFALRINLVNRPSFLVPFA